MRLNNDKDEIEDKRGIGRDTLGWKILFNDLTNWDGHSLFHASKDCKEFAEIIFTVQYST